MTCEECDKLIIDIDRKVVLKHLKELHEQIDELFHRIEECGG